MRILLLFGSRTFLLFFVPFFALERPLMLSPHTPFISFFYFLFCSRIGLLGLDCRRGSPSGLFPQPSVLPRTLYRRGLQLWTKAHWKVFRPRWDTDRWSLLIPACHTLDFSKVRTIHSVSSQNRVFGAPHLWPVKHCLRDQNASAQNVTSSALFLHT